MAPTPYVHLEAGALATATAGTAIDLDSRARHHLDRVLRLRPGARIEVADGEGREAPAVFGHDTVTIDGPVVEHERPDVAIHLIQAMPKGRKLDDVVRSVTELGVDVVTVVVSERSVSRPDDTRGPRLLQRWQEVASSAAEQSRRPWLPLLQGPVDLDEALSGMRPPLAGVVGHPDAPRTMRAALADVVVPAGGEVVGAVGPEGGWTDDEVARMTSHGLQVATLGGFTLRTEHAGFALCTVLAYYLGRMG